MVDYKVITIEEVKLYHKRGQKMTPFYSNVLALLREMDRKTAMQCIFEPGDPNPVVFYNRCLQIARKNFPEKKLAMVSDRKAEHPTFYFYWK